MSANTVKRTKKACRKTIGMLTDWIEDQYQLNLLHGIEGLARQRDLNLLCFEGASIDSPVDHEARRNIVYNWASEENIAGLILLSASIGHHVSYEKMARFVHKFSRLPVVVIGNKFPGLPCIMVDNTGGIEMIVTHLAKVHGCKNFAFIKGTESSHDSLLRYDAFIKTLNRLGLPFNPDLVVCGNYTTGSGRAAIKTLLDEKKAVFDAVIASNDDMAAGALQELNTRGISVPGQVAVTGFDNLDYCAHTKPPLTTISYSIYEMGWRAAEILLDVMEKKAVPEIEILPVRPVIRESCGCRPLTALCQNTHDGTAPGLSKVFGMGNKKGELAEICDKRLKYIPTYQRKPLARMIEILAAALRDKVDQKAEEKLVGDWEEFLEKASGSSKEILEWQEIIAELHNQLAAHINNREDLIRAEDLLSRIRIMISEKALQLEIKEHGELNKRELSMSFLREELLAAMDEEKIMAILADNLPGLGIKRCYIVKLEGENHEKAKLIFTYDKENHLDINRELLFTPQKLLPGGALFNNRRCNILVVAISSVTPIFGFILFEMDSLNGRIYDELRRIICGALQNAAFFNEIAKQAKNLTVQKETLKKNLSQLRQAMRGFIDAIALTVETRDPYTAGHQHRVAQLATTIAVEMDLFPEQVEAINISGTVHDLGKIYIPSEILNKPGKLRDIEFGLIKNHPEVAYGILKTIDFPWPIAQIILQHHERLDGSGYPNNLKDSEIMLEAKILAVADVVEAMISHRPYRAAFDLEQALYEIRKNSGILYEPGVVDVCLDLFKKGFKFKK